MGNFWWLRSRHISICHLVYHVPPSHSLSWFGLRVQHLTTWERPLCCGLAKLSPHQIIFGLNKFLFAQWMRGPGNASDLDKSERHQSNLTEFAVPHLWMQPVACCQVPEQKFRAVDGLSLLCDKLGDLYANRCFFLLSVNEHFVPCVIASSVRWYFFFFYILQYLYVYTCFTHKCLIEIGFNLCVHSE